MTGYTVHTGSTEKFAAGWDQIFGKGRRAAGGKGTQGAGARPAKAKAKAKAKKGKPRAK